MLERVRGPACPHCGCQQGDTLSESTETRYERQGAQLVPSSQRTVQRRRCAHCGRVFLARLTVDESESDIVEFPQLRCPHCRSTSTVVTSTRGLLRYHKCRGCRLTFRSREAG